MQGAKTRKVMREYLREVGPLKVSERGVRQNIPRED
jgi:hypothetical protein